MGAQRTWDEVLARAFYGIASMDCGRIGIGGCQKGTRLNGVWFINQWIYLLYAYISGLRTECQSF